MHKYIHTYTYVYTHTHTHINNALNQRNFLAIFLDGRVNEEWKSSCINIKLFQLFLIQKKNYSFNKQIKHTNLKSIIFKHTNKHTEILIICKQDFKS